MIFDKTDYRTFDVYKKTAFGMVYLTEINRVDCKNESKCTCYSFLKENLCKHILGLAIRLNLCEVPATAITNKLSQKRKRGRKTKAEKALLIQAKD